MTPMPEDSQKSPHANEDKLDKTELQLWQTNDGKG